jgi:hypothetical protein
MDYLEQPTPTRDIKVGLADLRRLGYALHLDFVDSRSLKELTERTKRQAEAELEHGYSSLDSPRRQLISFLANKGRCFIDLMMNRTGLAYTRELLETNNFKLFSQNGMILRPGKRGVDMMHTDLGSLGFTSPKPLLINIMIALENYNDETGSTRFVPRSHLGPLPDGDPESPDQKAQGVAVDAPPGAAIIWESRTWHRAGFNRSNHDRVSVNTLFCHPMINQQFSMLAGLHDSVYRALSDEELGVLGYKDYGGYNITCPRSEGDIHKQINRDEPYIPELA